MRNPDEPAPTPWRKEQKPKSLSQLKQELKEKQDKLDRYEANLKKMRNLPVNQSHVQMTEEICLTLHKEIDTLREQIKRMEPRT